MPWEYATIRFPDGEEHIIPRALLFKSPKIDKEIHHSPDNSIEITNKVASSTFYDLMRYLSGKHLPLDQDHLDKMVEAAHELEIPKEDIRELTQLTYLFWRQQQQGGQPLD